MFRRFAKLAPLRGIATIGLLGGIVAALPGVSKGFAEDHADVAAAERHAVAYLAREVPLWSRENRCFSCHNNGDATRALLVARKSGRLVPKDSLNETIEFLARPEGWDKNGVDAAFNDKSLARLQFANALATAFDTGVINDRSRLIRAAARLVEDQTPDGSWPIDEPALIGSPTTYGPALATALARRILLTADADRFSVPIARAADRLRTMPIRNLLETSAVVIGLEPGEMSDALRRRCLDLIRKGESADGGWGPFTNASAETFDTAITLLALRRWPDLKEVAPLINRGRNYLVASQDRDGSWPETTRPSGGESYAQRLSTSGWATLALLATD